MRVITRALTGAATLAMVGLPTFAFAQDAQPQAPTDQTTDQPPAEQDIVVTGIRASLESAQGRKRDANAIVDSIVADDIGKLPDANTAEALQRVSGIQVGRDRGEGGSVAIRGLTQVLTTLNGRAVFTADGGRSYNLQDFPSELLAGIDVYKTPSADLIEGGIGGIIDLRTRKPLDLEDFTVTGTLRGRYSDLVDKISPLGSLLVSKKWDTGVGEMGLLLSGSYQERAFRSDVISTGAPSQRTDIIAGRTITTPNGDYEPLINGKRRRIGLDGTFQWKPSAELELYAQASYQEFRSLQEQRGLNNPTNNGSSLQGGVRVYPVKVDPTTVETFPDTDDLMRATFLNVPVSTYGVQRNTYDKNQQYSIGGRWDNGDAILSGDFTYQKSSNDLYYTELDLATTAPRATLDISNKLPSMLFEGVDLNDINSYRIGSLTRNENHYRGDMYAGRVDAEFKIESPFLSGFKTGARYQKMSTAFTPVRFFAAPSNLAASGFSDMFEPMPFTDYFSGSSGLEHDYLTAITQPLNGNFDSIREALGLAPQETSQLSAFDISEETMAGYAEMLFNVDGPVRIDGNVGVRVVKTDLNIDGNQQVAPGAPITPINYNNSYTSVLPSANVRFRFTDQLQLRLAASQTLTRPTFSQLSPSLTLVPGQGQGSGGNPNLKPLRADQLDASLEYYFSRTGSVYLAGFYRKVKGFIFTLGNQQTINGIDYVISQPINGDDGTIKGIEVGGQTFFDFLPAPFDGLGVQANYTYIDSNTPSATAGVRTTLPGLSKNSFNISGLYEKNGLSVRVAYNYRSDYLGSLYGIPFTTPTQLLPVYTKGYGWLDASVNYDITKNVTVTLEGSNLLRRKEVTYYDVETRPSNYSIDDIQIMAGVRFKL